MMFIFNDDFKNYIEFIILILDIISFIINLEI